MSIKEITIAKTAKKTLLKRQNFIGVKAVKVLMENAGINEPYEVHHIFVEDKTKYVYSVHFIRENKIIAGVYPNFKGEHENAEKKENDSHVIT